MEKVSGTFFGKEDDLPRLSFAKKVPDTCSGPQICLVAIEPVSNYLLLEQYSPKRAAQLAEFTMF
jgi:hypothetical protein